MTNPPLNKSDLGVRTASAIVMVAVAGTALWLGDWVWMLFVAALSCGVLWEWRGLVRSFANTAKQSTVWNTAGFIYIAMAAGTLLTLRSVPEGLWFVLALVGAVVGTDIGAYFTGRSIGGPKIAPKISPSKTWSGLFGGAFGAAAMLYLITHLPGSPLAKGPPLAYLAMGAVIAVIAQAGDFFESWMKRRAGVKDSGHLLPGHGGMFDRTDGLLAVCFIVGVVTLGLISLSWITSGSPLFGPA